MSKALNYSGVSLPNAPSRGGTIIGKDKYKYWIRVADLKKYLYELFNKPDIEEKAGPNAVDKFNNKKVLLYLKFLGGEMLVDILLCGMVNILFIQEILIMMIPILFIIISI